MNVPQEVTINSIGPGTITVKVKISAGLKVRFALAVLLIRIAALILGMGVEFKHTR